MATMSVDRMRANVISVYPYPKWRNKVNNMAPNQVIAIYNKMLAEGKFEPKIVRMRKKHEKEANKYHQMTIFEYLEGK